MEASADWFRRVHAREFFSKFYGHEVRPDGRHILGTRRVAVSAPAVTHALGSALVRIGNTSVIAAVNALLAQPNPMAPKQGNIGQNKILAFSQTILSNQSF